jgi:hypothetical protein
MPLIQTPAGPVHVSSIGQEYPCTQSYTPASEAASIWGSLADLQISVLSSGDVAVFLERGVNPKILTPEEVLPFIQRANRDFARKQAKMKNAQPGVVKKAKINLDLGDLTL